MGARTTQKTGNVSDVTVWDGGTALLDGDSITIAANHVLTWDVDKSAWTTGVAGITITSHATTPAQLTFPTSGGPYYLPLAAAGFIQGGSSGATLGQFYIGSVGTPIPQTTLITIKMLSTSGGIKSQYLDMLLYGTNPTNKFVRATNAESIAATVIEVDTDVTADWANGDIITICDILLKETEVLTISSIAAGAITFTGGLVVAKSIGAYLVKVNRNVELIGDLISTNIALDIGAATKPQVCNIGIRRITPSTTLMSCISGQPLLAGLGSLSFGGCASGALYQARDVRNFKMTSEGVLVGGANGFSPSSTATHAGGSIGGSIFGCVIGMQGVGNVLESTGLIAACDNGVQRWALNDIAGKIVACTYAFGSTALAAGDVILRQGCVIGGSGIDANSQDILAGNLVGYGANLRSSTQVASYLTIPALYGRGARVVLWDVADSGGTPQPGYLAWWSSGGYGKSEAWVVGTHGTPPVTLAYVHKSNFESTYVRNFIDIPIIVPKGQRLTVTVYVKKSTNSMSSTPKVGLIDEYREWGHASEYLSSVTMTDDTNWQTLTLTYNATEKKHVALRVEGRHATGNMYWNYNFVVGDYYDYGGAMGELTLTKETGANARGGSGTCAKLLPTSTTVSGYLHFLVPCVASTPLTVSFYYNATNGFNGTIKVSQLDSDNVTFLDTSRNVSGTYDGTWRQYAGFEVTPTSTGFITIRVEVLQGSHSANDVIYLDDFGIV